MLPRHLSVFVAVFLLAAMPALAEVKWASTDALLELDSGQESGTARFEFVNDNPSPVKIVRIAPGCGCTVPTLEKDEFAAGESGSFTARFTIGERRGVYRIPIHVDFEDGSVAELNLVAQIRELVKYFPVNLVWAAGEPRKPKDIELHWQASDPVEVTQVRSVNAAFKAELVPDHDWSGALVRITPDNDQLAGTTVIVVHTAQGPERRNRVYTIVGRAL